MYPVRHAPVVVMRPFPNGAGYAYDEGIDQPTLTAITRAFSPIYQKPAGQTFTLTLPDGRCVIGDKIADSDCLDPLARDRHPTITRGALLDRPPSPRLEARLRRDLNALPLPKVAGPNQQLHVRLPRPIQVPEPTLRIAAPAGVRPGLLLTGLLAIEVSLAFLVPPASPVAWAVRGLAFAGAYWYALTHSAPLPTREQLTDLERRYLGEESGRMDMGLFQADRTNVTLDGAEVRSQAPGLPEMVSEPQYTSVVVSPGLVLLRGEEWAEWDGAEPVRCPFLRCYRLEEDRWKLHLVQWQRPDRPVSEPETLDPVLAETPSVGELP